MRDFYRARLPFEMVATGFGQVRLIYSKDSSYLLKQVERRSIKLTPVVEDNKRQRRFVSLVYSSNLHELHNKKIFSLVRKCAGRNTTEELSL